MEITKMLYDPSLIDIYQRKQKKSIRIIVILILIGLVTLFLLGIFTTNENARYMKYLSLIVLLLIGWTILFFYFDFVQTLKAKIKTLEKMERSKPVFLDGIIQSCQKKITINAYEMAHLIFIKDAKGNEHSIYFLDSFGPMPFKENSRYQFVLRSNYICDFKEEKNDEKH